MRRVLLAVVALAVLETSCNIERRPTDPETPITQVVVLPDTVLIDPLGSWQFDVFGRDRAGDTVQVSVDWSASAGSITSSALYTADSSEDDVTVTAALTASPSLRSTAFVRKNRVVQLILQPGAVSLMPGATQGFSVRGVRRRGDTVDVSASYTATGGSINSAGIYTAGSVPGTYSVIARRRALADTAVVTILNPPVASVSVSPASSNLFVGRTVQLAATARDAAGNVLTGRSITWSSSASGIASVSASGVVSGSAAGSATITATSEGQTGSATITVALVPVASVVVAPGSGTLRIGTSAQFSATTKDSAGNTLTGRAVTWSSSAPGVASVSANGLVNGVSAGSVTITASSEGKSGTSSVTVTVVPVATVTVAPASASVVAGGTVQLSATARDSAGNVLSGRVVTWASNTPAVATVATSGLVTAVAPGSATITATSEGKSATASVTVMAVPVATVTVAPATADLVVGGTAQLSATAKDAAGNILSGRVVTWSSTATGVATVSASGLVTAVGAGSATITATSEGKSGSSAVTVIMVPVASVTVAPATKLLRIGSTGQLTATTKDSAGNVLNGRAITWSSSASGVATVSASGLVTAVAAGSTTITATSEGQSGTSVITVTIVPVSTVTVTPSPASVNVGSTVQLSVVTKDSAGNVLSGRAVMWSSSVVGIGTVSTSGLVSGIAVGSTTITATSEGKSGTSVVTVNDPSSVRAGKYVSPTGSSSGDGSVNQPWDLRTALSGAGGRVRAGDTVWIRGGTYSGSFTSSLTGSQGLPVVVRAYPGERAIIDGAPSTSETFIINGDWSVFWGLEIMNSLLTRDARRPQGIYVNGGSHVKLINFIVHDVGEGLYTESSADDVEIYGSIFYNQGWQTSIRSDGHGVYVKNSGPGSKVVRDNVFFNSYGLGIHGYTDAGDGFLRNLVIEGNVMFNAGTLSTYPSANLLLGGEAPVENGTVKDNFLYFSPGKGSTNARMGYLSVANPSLTATGNYIVGGSTPLDLGFWTTATVSGNTVFGSGRVLSFRDDNGAGYAWAGQRYYRDPTANAWLFNGSWTTMDNWQRQTGLGGADATSQLPTQPAVFVRPNAYEAGRATIVVYNWSRQSSITVDLSTVLPPGVRYQVRSVQDLFGAVLTSGTFGGSITIPMGAVSPTPPIGGSHVAPTVTGPDFDVFVVTIQP